MTAHDTEALIVSAVEGLQRDVPSLGKLTLVARLELRAHGGGAPIWRVEVPGPRVTKEASSDARLDITINRPDFNELAKDGRLRDWVDAYERGRVSVNGDAGMIKLLGNVIERRLTAGRP